MLETETLYEEIGYFWGMSSRKFSLLPKKEIERYENLENKLFELEAGRENCSGILQ